MQCRAYCEYSGVDLPTRRIRRQFHSDDGGDKAEAPEKVEKIEKVFELLLAKVPVIIFVSFLYFDKNTSEQVLTFCLTFVRTWWRPWKRPSDQIRSEGVGPRALLASS